MVFDFLDMALRPEISLPISLAITEKILNGKSIQLNTFTAAFTSRKQCHSRGIIMYHIPIYRHK